MKTKVKFLPAANTLLKLLRLDGLDVDSVSVMIEKGKQVKVIATMKVGEHQLDKNLADGGVYIQMPSFDAQLERKWADVRPEVDELTR